MQITILEYSPMSAKTKSALEEAQRDIAELVKDQAKLADDEQSIARLGSTAWDDECLTIARGLPARRLNLLRRELSIRHRLEAEYFSFRHDDAIAAYDAAIARSPQTELGVLRKLSSIGFDTDAGCIGIIRAHPAVQRALQDQADWQSRVQRQADEIANDERILKIEQQLDAMKRHILSAVA